MPVERLSGGNRQKVAIAKWLLSGADVLIMDDPARGVDVGAKVELYRVIAGHAESGGAVVLASSDLDELLALSRSPGGAARRDRDRDVLGAAIRQGGNRADSGGPPGLLTTGGAAS